MFPVKLIIRLILNYMKEKICKVFYIPPAKGACGSKIRHANRAHNSGFFEECIDFTRSARKKDEHFDIDNV